MYEAFVDSRVQDGACLVRCRMYRFVRVVFLIIAVERFRRSKEKNEQSVE